MAAFSDGKINLMPLCDFCHRASSNWKCSINTLFLFQYNLIDIWRGVSIFYFAGMSADFLPGIIMQHFYKQSYALQVQIILARQGRTTTRHRYKASQGSPTTRHRKAVQLHLSTTFIGDHILQNSNSTAT